MLRVLIVLLCVSACYGSEPLELSHPYQPTPGWVDSAFWVSTGADLGTTWDGLRSGRASEANPVLTVFGDDAGSVVATGLVVNLAAYWAVKRLHRRGRITRRQASVSLNIFAGAHTFAAVHNHRVTR